MAPPRYSKWLGVGVWAEQGGPSLLRGRLAAGSEPFDVAPRFPFAAAAMSTAAVMKVSVMFDISTSTDFNSPSGGPITVVL